MVDDPGHRPDGPRPGPPETFTWKAPPLNTELLRFTPEEVEQIITYGRPGTPMQALRRVRAVAAKNEQTIADLVAYIQSIQLTPDQSKKNAEKESSRHGRPLTDQVAVATAATSPMPAKALADAHAQKWWKRRGYRATTSDADIAAQRCNDARRHDQERPGRATDEQATEGKACRTFLTAYSDEQTAAAALAGRSRGVTHVDVSDGQLLFFETYCALPHAGLVDLRPDATQQRRVLGPAGGGGGQGGGIGFNLRDGDTERRFGPGAAKGALGFDSQLQFVQQAPEANKGYGNGGIGSGRMPAFANMLTEKMIEQIVSFERNTSTAPCTWRRRPPRRRLLRPRRRLGARGDGSGQAARPRGRAQNLWDPTILGVLVALSAVGLFCGFGLPAARHQPRRDSASSSPARASPAFSCCSPACGSRRRPR